MESRTGARAIDSSVLGSLTSLKTKFRWEGHSDWLNQADVSPLSKSSEKITVIRL